MKNMNHFALFLVTALVLTACGAGNGHVHRPPLPAQNMDSSETSANYKDIGVGATGTLTYRATGAVVTIRR